MSAIDLAFKSFGSEGSPLIILHGLLGAGRNWYTIARKLTENHQVFLPDLRNHGASPHSPFMDYPDLAADLVRFLDQQRIETAAVIGHSMGGKVAMWLALNESERVSQLIAVDIAPVKYDHNFNEILSALRSLPLAEIRSRRQAEDWLSKSIRESSLCQFLLQNLVSDNDRYRWRIDLEVIHQAIPDLLGFPPLEGRSPYQGDALLIGGSRSRYVLPEHSEVISQVISNARIEIIRNAGHWVHIDQPEIFLKMVRDFLRRDS